MRSVVPVDGFILLAKKATEHVFGCVLCALGCFSLFRASALMDDNIMHKYTKTASEPVRSDAEMYAPEGFHEFFNQRRRWTLSSIANTVDLLDDYKVSSIVFTMLVYAQVTTFEVESTESCCTTFYRLAATNQIILETALSPTPIFVLCMIGIFVLAAVLHPQEFHNIFYGLAFFLMIPCTHIFMALYALINLNVINWGTREAASAAVGKHASYAKFRDLLRRLGFFKVFDFVRSTPSWRSTTTTTTTTTTTITTATATTTATTTIITTTTTATITAVEVQEIKRKVTTIGREIQGLKEQNANFSSVRLNTTTKGTSPLPILSVSRALSDDQKKQGKIFVCFCFSMKP
ncbi:Chitin synthase family protein [Acanthocheilonema viteae]